VNTKPDQDVGAGEGLDATTERSPAFPAEESVVDRKAPANWRRPLLVHGLQVLLVLVWLGAWELVTKSGWLLPVMSKTPADVWNFMFPIAKSGQLGSATWATLEAVLIAFALAIVTGVPCGIALALLPKLERVVNPFIDALNSAPRIILAPVFLVGFGVGITAKVALAYSLCFFIILFSTRTGVRAVDPELLWLSRALGATKSQVFWKVYLSIATPAIFDGMRLTMIFALFGVTSSELIASSNGLGNLVATYSNLFEMAGVYGIILVIIIIASILNGVMRFIELRVVRWQQPEGAR
jgi:NitT/TauT family transport system permease protein